MKTGSDDLKKFLTQRTPQAISAESVLAEERTSAAPARRGLGAFLRDVRGEGYLRVCILLLALTAVFSAVLYYAEQVSLVKEVQNQVRVALDSMSMQASVRSFEGEMNGGEVEFVWEEADFDDFLLQTFSGLQPTDDGYVCTDDDGTLLWEITRPVIAADGEGELCLGADFEMTLPMCFGGTDFSPVVLHLHVDSNRRMK